MNKKVMLICWRGSPLTAMVAALVLLSGSPLYAQATRSTAPVTQDQKALLDEIAKLRRQVQRLQATVKKCQTVGCPPAAAMGAAGTAQAPGKAMAPGAMQGGNTMEHPMGGGMQGGGMEHPMGAMGAGSPTPASGGMGDQPKPGMGMDQMHGGGMGMPPSSPTAPAADPSGGMGHM